MNEDEFFGELADTIDRADELARQRLGAGELDRRRAAIMALSAGRGKPRRLSSVAAAAVVFAILLAGGLVAGGSWFPPGPSIDAGDDRLTGTDPRSGLRADLTLERTDGGTRISFTISGAPRPGTYRLCAVHVDGTPEKVVTWRIGDRDRSNPDPLLLQAVTATPREDIARLRVEQVMPDGTGRTLVSVP